MKQCDRYSILPFGKESSKVNRETLNLSSKLRERVQSSFKWSPKLTDQHCTSMDQLSNRTSQTPRAISPA